MNRESSAIAFMEGICKNKIETMLRTGDISDGRIDLRTANKHQAGIDARNAKIKEHYDNGMTVTKIGPMFGLSSPMVTRIVASMNCKSSKDKQADRDAVIVRMKQFGQYSAKSIARILGIAPSTVGHALNRQGIYKNPRRGRK